MINPRQIRILIVDDEQEIRDLLSARFNIFGLQTVTADGGDRAWELISTDPEIKIVISDLHMAKGTGHELLSKCKALHAEYPKVFAITGQSQFSAEETMALGAEGFIHKPFDARALLHTVRNALLSLDERLRYPPHIAPVATISSKYASLNEAFASGHFALGRGGCYFSHKASGIEEGQMVELNLQFGDFHLLGAGIVKWSRSPSKGEMALGVEFTYLQKTSLELFQKWLKKNTVICFIPSPQISSSIPSTAKLQSTG
jgi:CheY-like chemotaxis protein